MSLDGIPYIGPYSASTENLYVATGFNKWGMTSSMAAAMILCDMVQGKENPCSPIFSPSRSMLHPQLAVNAWEAAASFLTPTTKRCPHLGCALKWNPCEHSWDCPCHGSRFTENGRLIDNPSAGNWKKGDKEERPDIDSVYMTGSNSLMAYDLVRLNLLLPNSQLEQIMEKQLHFMAGKTKRYPAGAAMYLTALSDHLVPSPMLTVVKSKEDIHDLPLYTTSNTVIRVLDEPTDSCQITKGETTLYICKGNTCFPPVTRSEFFKHRQNCFSPSEKP